MKTTTLRKLTAGITALCLCFAMASCGSSSSEKDKGSKTGSDSLVTEKHEDESADDLNSIEAIPYDQKPLSNDFFAYQFEIEGDVITLPIKLGELKSLGYVFDDKSDFSKGTTLIHAHKEYGEENDSIKLSLRCVDDTVYQIDLSDPKSYSDKEHTIKISGNITFYSDDYEKILASINGIKCGSYGDQFKKDGAQNSFIRLYNNGTPSNVLASVFMCNYDALSEEQKAKSNFVET